MGLELIEQQNISCTTFHTEESRVVDLTLKKLFMSYLFNDMSRCNSFGDILVWSGVIRFVLPEEFFLFSASLSTILGRPAR